MSIELKINTQRGKRYLVITERYWDKEAKRLNQESKDKKRLIELKLDMSV